MTTYGDHQPYEIEDEPHFNFLCAACLQDDANKTVCIDVICPQDEVQVQTDGSILPNIGLAGVHTIQKPPPPPKKAKSPFAGVFSNAQSSQDAQNPQMGFLQRAMNMPEDHRAHRFPDGTRYEGQFVGGKYHNHGHLRHASGSEYEGQFKEGMAHGQGTFREPDGTVYVGQWENDMKEGQGVEYWADGVRYEGHFKGGRKNEKGYMIWPNGASYNGQFVDDEFEGEGTYHQATEGKTYTGQWMKSEMHGMGTFRFSDGHFYKGQYQHNARHGHGVFVWTDGSRYDGMWKNDQEHGKGTWTEPTGEEYEGKWRYGKPEKGYGIGSKASKRHAEHVKLSEDLGEVVIVDAMAQTVLPQMAEWMASRNVLKSDLSGTPLTARDAVVEHLGPTGHDLAKAFLKDEKIKAIDVEVFKDEESGKYMLRDQHLLDKWLTYHFMHAEFCVVSGFEHRKGLKPEPPPHLKDKMLGRSNSNLSSALKANGAKTPQMAKS